MLAQFLKCSRARACAPKNFACAMKSSTLVVFFEATAKVVNVEKTEAKSREVFASDLNPDYAQLSSALSDGHSAQLNYFFKNERNILTFIIARFQENRAIGELENLGFSDSRGHGNLGSFIKSRSFGNRGRIEDWSAEP